MPRRPANFRQADLTRAIKAARAAGLEVERTEIGPDGKLILIHKQATDEPMNDFDKWKARRDAR